MQHSFRRIFLTICLTSSLLFPALAHAAKKFVLSSYYVVSPQHEQLSKVAAQFEVLRRGKDLYEIYVPQHQARHFRTLLPQARLVYRDIREELNQQLSQISAYQGGYRSYDEVVALLKKIETEHAAIAQLEIIGKTGQRTPLYALKLSDNVQQEESGEKPLMITAATHGDELLSTEVFLSLIEELVAGYEQDSRLKKILDQHALYLIPVANPDGFIHRERYDNGVDPNRDFPYPNDPNHQSIPSVQAIINFAHKHQVEGVMDFHNYGSVILYPWGYTWSKINDPAMAARLDEITAAMAAENGFDRGQISRRMYLTFGSSADYYLWKLKAVALGVEIGTNSKAPHPREIPRFVNEAREMTWRFIESFQ
jgi:hypothetical protein